MHKKIFCRECKWLITHECHAPNNMQDNWYGPKCEPQLSPSHKNMYNKCPDFEPHSPPQDPWRP